MKRSYGLDGKLFNDELFDEADWQGEVRRRSRRQPRRRSCECGDDMPGTCPGPTNCPHAEHRDED